MEHIIRPMIESDIRAFADAFIGYGWGDRTKTLTKYFREQGEGTRKVLVCETEGKAVGYLTILPEAPVGPYAGKNIPEIVDFNVLIEYRGNGFGWALMDAAEAKVKETHDEICLGVGLYTDYGRAQRMYVKRGYIPDGTGIWWDGKNLPPYENCVNDDDLVMYLSKKL
jgi:GNAT superfamily N-acetyltransferase